VAEFVVLGRRARHARMAAELEVLIELGFVVHTPIFEELVVLESEDRLAWGKCSAAALDIPNDEDRDGIDAETLPQGVHQPPIALKVCAIRFRVLSLAGSL